MLRLRGTAPVLSGVRHARGVVRGAGRGRGVGGAGRGIGRGRVTRFTLIWTQRAGLAMDPGGYIKVWRKMLDSEVMEDDWLCRLWIWCLLKAKWEPSKRAGKPSRGQFVTSGGLASEELKVSRSKWLRGIERLRALRCVDLDTNHKRT